MSIAPLLVAALATMFAAPPASAPPPASPTPQADESGPAGEQAATRVQAGGPNPETQGRDGDDRTAAEAAAEAGKAPREAPREPPRRLVFANTYAVNWSVASARPSGELSLFLGSSLRPRLGLRNRVWTTALGYELTVSLGAADLHTAFYSFPGDYGLFYHRHHLAALGYGARDNRLFYQFGGGLLLYNSTPTALEADLRLGCVLGVRRPTRIKGMVGGQARLVVILDGTALPQFGLFAGWMFF